MDSLNKTESLRVFFTDDELKEVEEFKKDSGMTFKAITIKAIDYFKNNNIPYIKSDYIFYSNIGKSRKKPKSIGLPKSLDLELSEYCEKNSYTKSAVAAQAILAYIRDKK